TAAKLLKQFATVDNVYENLDDVSGKKLKEKLENHKDDAFMSKQLVTIDRESPIDVSLKKITYEGYPQAEVSAIFKDLGFQSLVNRINGEGEGEDEERNELSDIDYTIVDDITEEMLGDETALVLEMLEENYHYGKIEGIGVVNQSNAYFIPTETALESEVFKSWAEDSSMSKVVFDAKKTLVIFLNKGIHIKGITFDMLLTSYLLNPAENNHDIPAIAHRMGVTDVLFDEEVYGKGAKMKVPE